MNTPIAILMVVGPALVGLLILCLSTTKTVEEAIKAWLFDICLLVLVGLTYCSMLYGMHYLVNPYK